MRKNICIHNNNLFGTICFCFNSKYNDANVGENIPMKISNKASFASHWLHVCMLPYEPCAERSLTLLPSIYCTHAHVKSISSTAELISLQS